MHWHGLSAMKHICAHNTLVPQTKQALGLSYGSTWLPTCGTCTEAALTDTWTSCNRSTQCKFKAICQLVWKTEAQNLPKAKPRHHHTQLIPPMKTASQARITQPLHLPPNTWTFSFSTVVIWSSWIFVQRPLGNRTMMSIFLHPWTLSMEALPVSPEVPRKETDPSL